MGSTPLSNESDLRSTPANDQVFNVLILGLNSKLQTPIPSKILSTTIYFTLIGFHKSFDHEPKPTKIFSA